MQHSYTFQRNCHSLGITVEPRILLDDNITTAAQLKFKGGQKILGYEQYPLLIIAREQLSFLEWNLYDIIRQFLGINVIVTIDRCPHTFVHGNMIIILADTLEYVLQIRNLLNNQLCFTVSYFLLLQQISVPKYYSIYAICYSLFKTRFQSNYLNRDFSSLQFQFFVQPDFHPDYYLVPIPGCNLQNKQAFLQFGFYSYNETNGTFQPYPNPINQAFINDVTNITSQSFRNIQVNLNFNVSRYFTIYQGQYFLRDELPKSILSLESEELARRRSICKNIFCLQEKYMYLHSCQVTIYGLNEMNFRLLQASKRNRQQANLSQD